MKNIVLKNPTTFLIFIVVILGCTNKEDVNHTSSVKKEIKITNELKIDLQGSAHYDSYSSYFIQNNDSLYLTRGSQKSSKIDYFNWETKKLAKSLRIETSGVNYITNYQGFHYPITYDSIILPVTYGRINIIKDKEVVLKNYFDNYPLGFVFYTTQAFPLLHIEDDIILWAIPDKQEFTQPESFLTPTLAKYSLPKDTIQHLEIKHPDFFNEKCWSAEQYKPLYTNIKNRLYYVFSAGGNFKAYDLITNKEVEYPKPPSKFVDWSNPIPLNKCGEYATPSSWIQDTQKAIHSALIHEPKNNIFYLITHLPVKDLDTIKEELMNNQKSPNFKPISVMALDAEFKLIDEIKLPPKKYNTKDFIVADGGIYISKNNELSESFDENYMIFDFFTVN